MIPETLTIDGSTLPITEGEPLLHVARRAGLDIPTLCYLDRCGPLNTCQVCLVKVNGKLVPSCGTKAEPGMVVESETEEVHEARRTALELLFSDHVGDCLSPCHRLCPLHLNIPVMIRQIEHGRLDEASQTMRQALPLAAVLGRLCHHPCEQGCRRGHWDEPAAIRDLERFVADRDLGLGGSVEGAGGQGAAPAEVRSPKSEVRSGSSLGASDATVGEATRTDAVRGEPRSPHLPPGKPASGKSVAIIGAGPAGLTAAWHLARQGHAVTVVDRHDRAGGSLRDVPDLQLPRAVLDAELRLLERLGIQFKLGVQLGNGLTLEGLRRGFNVILLAVGELTAVEADALGLPATASGLEADPNTGQTRLPGVFAAGSAVRAQKQLIRAMTEGRAVAGSVDLFLRGQQPRRPEKPFSSVMGRLTPGELKQFLKSEALTHRVSACDTCAGFDRREAAREAERCLHCDCRSSGECALQHWANVYSANANRFRAARKVFEQERQPAGILFEPGKCILCGICVRLCEQAAEPLGLTFVGRGFNVRVAAAFNEPIQAGLQKVAAECVEHCPTGALAFGDGVAGAGA
jgi:NADPH-dependent glutamate synthase beta subunit-like oxidoreductase/ferredoxin